MNTRWEKASQFMTDFTQFAEYFVADKWWRNFCVKPNWKTKKKLFIYATLDLAFLVMLKFKKIESVVHGRSAVSCDLAVLLWSRFIKLLPI